MPRICPKNGSEWSEVCIVFHDDAFETTLKQMTGTTMSVVESAGIGQGQPLHTLGKIGAIRS
jgi:hypothetical protein